MSDDARILAAGGLLWRDGSRRELALVRRRRHEDWSLPKGKVDGDETLQETAAREVEEETGLRPRVLEFAGETFYRVQGRPKSVLFWHMEPKVDEPVMTPDAEEVERVVWLPVEEALHRLSYEGERELVRRAMRSA